MIETTNTTIKQQQLMCKQSVIPPLVIDWLQQFGFRIMGMNGTTVIYFDEDSRRVLRSKMGADVNRRLSDMMDAYLVMTDERIIAVGHRFKSYSKPNVVTGFVQSP